MKIELFHRKPKTYQKVHPVIGGNGNIQYLESLESQFIIDIAISGLLAE